MTSGIAMVIELTNPGIKERIPTSLTLTFNALVMYNVSKVQVRSKVACWYDRYTVSDRQITDYFQCS